MRGTQIARFGTTPGGHLGDQLADHIGGDARYRIRMLLTVRD
jgi:hypothetical protein